MTQHKQLIRDLQTIAKEAVRKRGRRLSWLAFAKRRTPQGYAFFLGKETPWDVWHEIVAEASKLYPHYAFATITEIASELFNQEEEALDTFEPAY